MVLCLCNNVNEQDWNEALRRHAYDIEAARKDCGAGECCGVCVTSLHECVPLPEGLMLAI